MGFRKCAPCTEGFPEVFELHKVSQIHKNFEKASSHRRASEGLLATDNHTKASGSLLVGKNALDFDFL